MRLCTQTLLGVCLLFTASLMTAVEAPIFDHQRGWYDAEVSLNITAPTGATLRYTLDGSRPGMTHGTSAGSNIDLTIDNSTVVRAVALAGDSVSAVQTHSYLFVESVLNQGADAGGIPSDDAIKTAMDGDLIAGNEAAITAGLQQLPVLAISGDTETLFSDPGVLRDQGFDLETLQRVRAAVALEYFEPSSERSWQVDCGIEQAGQGSTSLFKKTLEIHFSAEYGPKRLREPLFDEDPQRPVDTLRLRLGGSTIENAFTQFGQQWVDDLQRQMSGYGQRGRFVQVFINGVYWGRYNAVERADADYAEETFGGDDDDWDHVRRGWEREGTLVDWFRLKALDNFAQTTSWQDAQELLALQHYVDYRLLSTFWELEYDMLREHRFLHNRHNGLGFIPVLWDTDWTLRRLVNDATRTPLIDIDPARDDILSRLWAHAEFRMLMADRIHRHFFADGALTTTALATSFDRRADEVAGTFLADRARWQADEFEGLEQDFPAARSAIENNLIPNRPALLRQHLRDKGLYPDVDAPTFDNASGTHALPLVVTLTNPDGAGTLYYTTDGSDPRLPGGMTAPTAIASEQRETSISIADSTHLRARVRIGDTWSALHEASYRASDQDDSALVVSELMYHPPAPPILGDAGWQATYCEDYNLRTNNVLAFNDVVGISLRRVAERIDSRIDLAWDVDTGPLAGMDAQGIAMMWSATLTPPADETVRFRLRSAGWMALWINGERVIDGWPEPDDVGGDGSLRSLSADVALAADQPHHIAILYAHPDDAEAQRFTCTWRRPGGSFEQIPTAYLRSEAHLPDNAGEFIELHNRGDRPLAIGGYHFTDGIDARLPTHLVLAPDARWVLGDNPRLFRERYGQAPDQTFAGSLANGGERLALQNLDDEPVLAFTWDDTAPWPTTPDGGGPSLVLRGDDPQDPSSWAPSDQSGGNPGGSDFQAPPLRHITIDVEPDDQVEAAIDDSPSTSVPATFTVPAPTTDRVIEFLWLGNTG